MCLEEEIKTLRGFERIRTSRTKVVSRRDQVLGDKGHLEEEVRSLGLVSSRELESRDLGHLKRGQEVHLR